ncbi:MAG: glycosyltransferase family 4 protein [Acidobacteriota bacterium]
MKILFPYLARWRSANRSRYHQLLTHLCRMGHEVHVLKAPPMALDDISARDVDSARVREESGLHLTELHAPAFLRHLWNTPIPKSKALKKGLLSLSSIDEIRRFVDREKIDVLLLYNLPQAVLLDRVACHRHFDLADDLVEMLGLEHSLLSRLGGRAAGRAAQNRLLQRADTVSVASSVLAEQIERRNLLLPNGADIAELDLADGSKWRARSPGPTVGFVGAFEYWVDFDLVFEIATRLRHLTFLLVGGGRRWTAIRERVNRERLTNIYLTGPMPYEEAMDYVAGMDICLLPFTHDAVSDGSCPLKLFEYAALRRPVVSTLTTEVHKIGSGWITFADDAATTADAIESLLADPKRSKEVAEAGREVVERHYNWEMLTKKFAEYLQGEM